MSGGRFLVSLKDVLISEKILKIKSLIKAGFDVDDKVKVTDELTLDLELLDNSVEYVIDNIDKIMLKDESREISDHIASYVAKKLSHFCKNCCDYLLFDRNSVGSNYHQLLSRVFFFFFFFLFMHFFSGTKHPREDNPNLYYWAEMTGLHTQTFNI